VRVENGSTKRRVRSGICRRCPLVLLVSRAVQPAPRVFAPMASMTFPGASGIPDFYSFDRPHHGSTSSVTDDEFELAQDAHSSMSSSHFTTGGSGFTVNPLSVRTPRVSLIGSTASSSSFAPMSASVSSIATSRPSPGGPQSQSGLVIGEDDLDSEIDIRTGSAPSKPVVRTEDVWREIVKSSNGRDKALVSPRLLSARQGQTHGPHAAETHPILTQALRALPLVRRSVYRAASSSTTGLQVGGRSHDWCQLDNLRPVAGTVR